MGLAKDFMDAFIRYTISTFKVQIGLDIKPGKPKIVATNVGINGDISGVIGITSNDFKGSLSLIFPEKVFLGVVSKMLMEDFDKISEENESAAGELANIILGNAKAELNEKNGHSIEFALPSIVTGKDHVLKSIQQSDESFIVPFDSECGQFHIKITMSK